MSIKEKILLVCFGLIMAFFSLEICLRLYQFAGNKQLFGFTPTRTNLSFYDHPVFGHAFVPNQKGWFVPHSKEYFTWVEINSHGWPDVEHKYTKPSDTYRILLLGDSFVENTQLPLNERFFRQVEENLNTNPANPKYKKIEVIALGRGNTGTAQQYLILKHYGILYNPDLVVQMFLTANDVKNNSAILQNDPYLPYFSLDENGNLVEIPHKARGQRKFAPIKDVLKNLRVVENLLWIRQQIQERKTNKQSSYPIDYHVYDLNYSQDYQTAWQITEKLLSETEKTARQHNANYILVTLANNEQVNNPVKQRILKEYPDFDINMIDFEKPDKIIANICTKYDLTCFQMLPYFQDFKKENPNTPTHNFYEGHWNKVGTDLAVKYLTQSLFTYLKNHN